VAVPSIPEASAAVAVKQVKKKRKGGPDSETAAKIQELEEGIEAYKKLELGHVVHLVRMTFI
jgi:hypothetical protein